MRLNGFISREDAANIHRSALHILEHVGVKVESRDVRRRLEVCGGKTKDGSDRVCFPASEVERQLSMALKSLREDAAPWIGAHVEVYGNCRYGNPETGKLESFNEEKLARYFGLAESMSMVSTIMLEGLPFAIKGIPASCSCLLERVYAWKFGVQAAGSIDVEYIEPLMELFACHGSAAGKKLEEVVDVSIGLASPLWLAKAHCEKLLFFSERGFRVKIFSWPVIGSTAPLSVVGVVVQGLAEQLFLYLLRRAFWGDASLLVEGAARMIDFRSKASCFGRPETQAVNLLFAEMGAFYGCKSGGMHGMTDAMTASYEAGAQKALGALATAVSSGYASVAAGALGGVSICSPVQMVLDNDLAGYLGKLLARPYLDELESVTDEIATAIRRGRFANHGPSKAGAGEEFFSPSAWGRGFDRAVNSGAAKIPGSLRRQIDADAARRIVADFQKTFTPVSHISPAQEREMLAIVKRAGKRKRD